MEGINQSGTWYTHIIFFHLISTLYNPLLSRPTVLAQHTRTSQNATHHPAHSDSWRLGYQRPDVDNQRAYRCSLV